MKLGAIKTAHADAPQPVAMPLGGHLREVRRRLGCVLLAMAVSGVVAFIAYPAILHALEAPYCRVSNHCRLYVTGPLDGLSLRIKIAAYGALALSLPVIFWQAWRFIAPGLTRREKRSVLPFVTVSIVMFVSGVLMAYEIFPHALSFLGSVGGPSLGQLYNPVSYLSLILALMLVFGITFEFPVVLVALELTHVVTPRQLAKVRRWAIVAIVIVAAVITPSGDPLSMFALAVPLYAFYEISILIGRLALRERKPAPLEV
jgi:sec-independent protein translocase protein TatC